jgi:hypothetical protein
MYEVRERSGVDRSAGDEEGSVVARREAKNGRYDAKFT